MKQIKCPHCHEAFKIDEAGYADIVNQVRNDEFKSEIEKREAFFQKEKENAVRLAEEQLKNSMQEKLLFAESEVKRIKAEKDTELLALMVQKDQMLAELKSQMALYEKEKELAITRALQEITSEKVKIQNELLNERKMKQLEFQNIETTFQNKLNEERQIKEAELKAKNEEIDRLKDFKSKLSVKLLGETLEKHCEKEFDRHRHSAFRDAYFEKDNTAVEGTKGDFIYRDYDAEKNEIISIMFEMKNQSDEGDNKKKNEDFLKKLDEDRKKKNCEYAVLVSMLEPEDEYYNSGIVDVSHKYPKMYVIRPQFFIPMISLLRNAALNAATYKAELARVKNQHIDITNFENDLNIFKDAFGKRYKLASDRFKDAIAEIDKSIKNLQNVKENLQKSDDHLRLANQKAEELTIKKLVAGNQTMTEKFNQLNQDSTI